MAVEHICIRMKKQAGTIQQITEVLKIEGVNILAVSAADLGDDLQISMVVDDPEKAFNIFEAKAFSFSLQEVVAAEVPHHPGALNSIVASLKTAQVDIIQLYSFLGRSASHAILILMVDKVDEAKKVLKDNWIRLVGEEIYGG